MDKKQLKHNLEEIAFAVSHCPKGDAYEDEPFDRNDDHTLVSLGFRYIDTSTMTGIVDGVTFYVDMEARNYPAWSYMVHGKQHSPRFLGTIKYSHVCNKLISLADYVKQREAKYNK